MSSKSFFQLRSAALLLALAGVAALPACAQQAASSQTSLQNLQLFSTSASNAQDDAVSSERANLGGTDLGFDSHIGPNPLADPQGGYGGPPRRRPYGRPTYKDRNSNADGSSKYAFEAGAGFAHPAGSTQHYQATSWNISVGAGRNFSRAFGVLMQYDYANMSVAPAIINAINAGGTSISGNTHLWSLTLNPVINFANSNSRFGAYLVGGGGFYRKVTTFTEPSTGTCYDPYYGYYLCSSNQVVAHWSNNAGGLNAGLGFTYKPSAYSNLKLFAESRYTWVDNQPSSHNTASNGYPPANYRTGYFPVTFGIRF